MSATEPKYNPQMLRADFISPEPIGVGTQFRAETVTMGRRSEMVIEFTAYDRPRRLASATHMSTMEIGGALTFAPVPDGTLMRWTWDLQPRGFLKLMSPLIARMGRRNELTIWTSLKRYLEAAQVE